MSFALSVIAKTTILLACAGLMTLALRRASASTRHAVWAIALLSALILPIASTFLPEVALPVLPENTLDAAIPLVAAGHPHFKPPGVPDDSRKGTSAVILAGTAKSDKGGAASDEDALFYIKQHTFLFLWVAGASVVLLRLLLGSLTIRRLRRHSLPLEGPGWADIIDDLRFL